jgi:hypothetical protein
MNENIDEHIVSYLTDRSNEYEVAINSDDIKNKQNNQQTYFNVRRYIFLY